MEQLHAAQAIGISEFKANPAAALKSANGQPFAVLTNNKPSFYVVSPELFETLIELYWDSQMTPEVERRLENLDLKKTIPLDQL